MKAANVRPITDLKNHAKELVQEVAGGGQPLVITQNGKARAVLMDVEQHDRLLDTLAMLKLLAHSQETLSRTGHVYRLARCGGARKPPASERQTGRDLEAVHGRLDRGRGPRPRTAGRLARP